MLLLGHVESTVAEVERLAGGGHAQGGHLLRQGHLHQSEAGIVVTWPGALLWLVTLNTSPRPSPPNLGVIAAELWLATRWEVAPWPHTFTWRYLFGMYVAEMIRNHLSSLLILPGANPVIRADSALFHMRMTETIDKYDLDCWCIYKETFNLFTVKPGLVEFPWGLLCGHFAIVHMHLNAFDNWALHTWSRQH